jgi:O-antigen/teichoic acid export membrane protein
MSVAGRLYSGSVATIVNIGCTLVLQIVLVPVYLVYWPLQRYGVWLALQSAVNILYIIDIAHQDYVGFEMMKLRFDDRQKRSNLLSSSLPWGGVTGIILLGVGGVSAFTEWGSHLLGRYVGDENQVVGIIIICYVATWSLYKPLGLIGRALVSVGHFPRNAWWSVAISAVGSLAPAIAVSQGYGIGGAAAANIAALAVVNGAICFDFRRTLKREGISLRKPNFKIGYRDFSRSHALAIVQLNEMLQQTGFRLVLLPFVGPASLALFSTLRTVANIVQQGINVLINPGTPELMRFVAVRDAGRTSAMMCLMWLLIVFLFAPAVVVLQLVAPFVFTVWTLGKMTFDGQTFALLSAALMVSGLSQPARAIIRGNNILRAQVGISIIASVALLGFTSWLAPWRGILGAALGLFGAECIRCAGSVYVARRWLYENDLVWPHRHFLICGCLVAATVATVFLLAQTPGRAPAVLMMFAVVYVVTLYFYWRELPANLRARASLFMRRAGVSFGRNNGASGP